MVHLARPKSGCIDRLGRLQDGKTTAGAKVDYSRNRLAISEGSCRKTLSVGLRIRLRCAPDKESNREAVVLASSALGFKGT